MSKPEKPKTYYKGEETTPFDPANPPPGVTDGRGWLINKGGVKRIYVTGTPEAEAAKVLQRDMERIEAERAAAEAAKAAAQAELERGKQEAQGRAENARKTQDEQIAVAVEALLTDKGEYLDINNAQEIANELWRDLRRETPAYWVKGYPLKRSNADIPTVRLVERIRQYLLSRKS